MDSKQNLLSAIAKNGWHLTPESVEDFLLEKPNLNSSDLVNLALNVDLRNIGAKYLPDSVVTGRAETFEGPAVLQLVKLRNIAAPKENESSMSAPPMYKLTLTDGTGNCNALVIDNDVSNLNINTAPGTKIQLKGAIKLKANLLILNSQNVQVLGGHVDHLVTKWKQAKELSQHVRIANLTETAPPPWVPFGARQTNQVDTSKKVFAQNETPDQEDGSEFSLARQAALAEAMEAKLKITKTFTQTTVDKSQVENAAAGMTSNETRVTSSAASFSHALPRAHNSTSISSGGAERGKPAGRGRGRRGRNFDDDDDDPRDARDVAKPATITLFDLIKTKVDIKGGEEEPAAKEEEREEPSRFDNDLRRGGYSRGGRFSNEGFRGGRGRGRGSRSYQQPAEYQASSAKKQVYDADDFAFELGDTTKVKDLKQNKPSAVKSAKNETEGHAFTSKPVNTNTYKTSDSNRNRADRDYNNTNSNDNYYDDNQSSSYRPESSNYKGRNYNPKYNQDNQNNNPSNYEDGGRGGGYRRSEQAQERSYGSSGPQGASNYSNDQPNSYNNSKPQRSKNYSNSNTDGSTSKTGYNNNNQQQPYYQPPSNVAPSSQASVATKQAPLPPPQPVIYQSQFVPKTQQAPQAYYDYYPPLPGQPQLMPVNQPFYPAMMPVQIPPSYASNTGGYYAPPMPADNMYAPGGYGGPSGDYTNKPQREPRPWKAGDQCLARYHDNEYYPAVIQKVIKNGNRFIVNYTEYDETNEVGLNDIQAKAYNKNKNYNNNRSSQPAGFNNNPRRNNNDS